MVPRVTFEGPEVAHVIGALIALLQEGNVKADDRYVIDLMLDKAISGIGFKLSPDIAARIERGRGNGSET